LALISSMASISEFLTVTSLMAIVPLSECRIPTLTVLPEEPGLATSPDSPPQAVSSAAGSTSARLNGRQNDFRNGDSSQNRPPDERFL
jgi:hypothetical protein